jgi:hypothetical protein
MASKCMQQCILPLPHAAPLLLGGMVAMGFCCKSPGTLFEGWGGGCLGVGGKGGVVWGEEACPAIFLDEAQKDLTG